jgi:L-amino acid N-acyltransferase YncA
MHPFHIRDATIADLAGYHACLGAVALERKYIGFVEPPPLASSESWMTSVLELRCPFLVACAGTEVVGWCDVGPRSREGFRHTGELGMGLLAHARGQGLGRALLTEAITRARAWPLEKLELQVYASNQAARHLYQAVGFAVEGRRVRARKLDGAYDDVLLMGLFL